MQHNITTDENGNYFLNGNRVLISYMRGDYQPVKNPVRSKFEPEYLVQYYPGPVGLVMAFVLNGELRFSYSKANIWRGDKFNKKIALQTCVDRAMMKNIQPPFEEVANNMDIYDALHRLYGRAKNYFKREVQQPPPH